MGKNRHRATTTEIQERRARVVALRFAKFSELEIGRRLGISASTASRDLQAAREEWTRRFGNNYDSGKEVGEGVALFGLLEATAVRELLRLEAETKRSTGAMMQCCWVARSARQARIDLLVDSGVIGSELEPALTGTDADSIRSFLRDQGLLNQPEASPDDNGQEQSDGEVIEQWLDGEL